MEEGQNQLIYSFPRGKGEEIQVAVRKYKGKYYIDLRQWFQGKNETTFLPTKKGVSFGLHSVRELRKAVDRLSKAAERLLNRQEEEEEIQL